MGVVAVVVTVWVVEKIFTRRPPTHCVAVTIIAYTERTRHGVGLEGDAHARVEGADASPARQLLCGGVRQVEQGVIDSRPAQDDAVGSRHRAVRRPKRRRTTIIRFSGRHPRGRRRDCVDKSRVSCGGIRDSTVPVVPSS